MISQLLVGRFSFCLIFCKPQMKLFNRPLILFCPNPDRLAAILKYVEFYLKFIAKSISAPSRPMFIPYHFPHETILVAVY